MFNTLAKNMAKSLFLSLLLFISFQSSFAASNGAGTAMGKSTGVGFVVGDPTGIVLQVNANTLNPIDFGAAYAWDHWFQFWGDYTFHYPRWMSNLVKSRSPIDAYWGVGAAILAADNRYYSGSFGLLARIPFGLEMKLETAPIGFFVELVPAILFAPATNFYFQAGLGLRFYF